VPPDEAAHRCPACRSDEVIRVPRKTTSDYVARILGWRVYRCDSCKTRFYDRPTPAAPQIAAVTSPELVELVGRLAQSL
jgi:transposase-like protein